MSARPHMASAPSADPSRPLPVPQPTWLSHNTAWRLIKSWMSLETVAASCITTTTLQLILHSHICKKQMKKRSSEIICVSLVYLGLPTYTCSYWNSSQFPSLEPAARKYLSAPPTSVASEKLFSAAGQIYADRCSNLLGENAEKLLFMAYNIRLFN